MPIQAVLFDFGGVLYHTPDPRPLLALLRHFGIWVPEQALQMMGSPLESQMVWDVMTGKIREETLWAEAAQAWRIGPRMLKLLRGSGYTRRRVNRELAGFLSGLRPRYKTAILTNAGTDFRETFCRVFELEKLVDDVIISAEEGLCKPDPAIYQFAAERLGVAPAAALLVDDRTENVAGAQQAGMLAILHRSNSETLRMVREQLKLTP